MACAPAVLWQNQKGVYSVRTKGPRGGVWRKNCVELLPHRYPVARSVHHRRIYSYRHSWHWPQPTLNQRKAMPPPHWHCTDWVYKATTRMPVSLLCILPLTLPAVEVGPKVAYFKQHLHSATVTSVSRVSVFSPSLRARCVSPSTSPSITRPSIFCVASPPAAASL